MLLEKHYYQFFFFFFIVVFSILQIIITHQEEYYTRNFSAVRRPPCDKKSLIVTTIRAITIKKPRVSNLTSISLFISVSVDQFAKVIFYTVLCTNTFARELRVAFALCSLSDDFIPLFSYALFCKQLSRTHRVTINVSYTWSKRVQNSWRTSDRECCVNNQGKGSTVFLSGYRKWRNRK